MSTTSDASVTHWLASLQAGDDSAAQRMWELYFPQLVRLAARRLTGAARRVADEEDVALSVFHSFCEAVQQGRIPRITDRHDLWRILVTLTARKAADAVRHQRRQKRGGGLVRGESVFDAKGPPTPDRDAPTLQQVVGDAPTPEFSALVRELLEQRLLALRNPTLREIALAKLEGYSNDEIAQQLGVVTRTVERKLALIRRKWSEEQTS